MPPRGCSGPLPGPLWPSFLFSDTSPIPSLLLWGGTPCYSLASMKCNVFTWPLLVGGDCIFFLWCWLLIESSYHLQVFCWLVCPFPVLWLKTAGFFGGFCGVCASWYFQVATYSGTQSTNVWSKTKQNKKQTSRDTHFYVVTQVPGRSAIFSTPFRVLLLFFLYIISSMFS